jgi:hypothetical protein
MEECLNYFRQAIEHPGTVPIWTVWWKEHAEEVRKHFNRTDYLRLKVYKLVAARGILERLGILPHDPTWGCEDIPHLLSSSRCRVCGEVLFKAMPGTTTPDEIRAFAERIGDEVIRRDGWIHPGFYCPNGCTRVLVNIRRLRNGSL